MGAQADALSGRVFESLIGSGELLSIYVGDRLGLYGALAEGPATAPELAGRAGIAERYAREWLEQQAVAGFLEVDDVGARQPSAWYIAVGMNTRRCCSTGTQLTYLTPYARMFVASAQQLPALHAGLSRRRRRELARLRPRHERGPGVRQPADLHRRAGGLVRVDPRRARAAVRRRADRRRGVRRWLVVDLAGARVPEHHGRRVRPGRAGDRAGATQRRGDGRRRPRAVPLRWIRPRPITARATTS